MILVVVGFSAGVLFAEGDSDEVKAVAKIQLLGGNVERDNNLPGRPVIRISFNQNCRFNEKYLHLLKPFENLKSLDLRRVPITAAGLKEVNEFTNLTTLYLRGAGIQDDGVTQLLDLKNLVELTLCDTNVTWVGLNDVRESLPKLRIKTESSMVQEIAVNVQNDRQVVRVKTVAVPYVTKVLPVQLQPVRQFRVQPIRSIPIDGE
jgi:hypothetical protein